MHVLENCIEVVKYKSVHVYTRTWNIAQMGFKMSALETVFKLRKI